MDQSGVLYALPFILLILVLRLLRGTRARPLRVERMWIVPAIFAVVIALSIFSQPVDFDLALDAVMVLAFAAGVGVGWFRGRMVRISIDVNTHALTSQQSPWGMLIFVGILVLRMGLRYVLGSFAEDWHLSVAAITDGFLLFYGGMIVGMRVEMWVRARKLLAEALAAKAAGKDVPAEVSQDHA